MGEGRWITSCQVVKRLEGVFDLLIVIEFKMVTGMEWMGIDGIRTLFIDSTASLWIPFASMVTIQRRRVSVISYT